MRRLVIAIVAATIVSAVLPAPARAEGTACLQETDLSADGRILRGTIPNATTFWFGAYLTAGRSYSLEVIFAKASYGSRPVVTGFQQTLASCTTSLAGTRDTTSIEPQQRGTSKRISFTAGFSDFHSFSVENTTGVDQEYSISLSETTLFSAAWSTNGSYATYYSFYNTTSSPINVTITLTTSSGSNAGSTLLAVPPGRTTSTNTVALATPANQAGTAIATHNGPPGAVLVESDIANFSFTPAYVQPVKFAPTREVR